MLIFTVNSERFLQESLIHINSTKNKHVEWYIDSKGIMHMYIITNLSTAYYYSSSTKTLPETIRLLISAKGAVTGILDDEEDKNVSISDDSLAGIARNLRLNQTF
ncbi:unnamed protein product [marine sediment metagenome]|uniref:Uncharacterized protein n=1 Tax=marine sediment metagenome TaxID=412755 RepID=X0VG27_9ZZZZ